MKLLMLSITHFCLGSSRVNLGCILDFNIFCRFSGDAVAFSVQSHLSSFPGYNEPSSNQLIEMILSCKFVNPR